MRLGLLIYLLNGALCVHIYHGVTHTHPEQLGRLVAQITEQ